MADGSTISISPPTVTIVQVGLTPVSGCTATVTRCEATEVDTEEVSTYWRTRIVTKGYQDGRIRFQLVVPPGCLARWKHTYQNTSGFVPEGTVPTEGESGMSDWLSAGTYNDLWVTDYACDITRVTTHYRDSGLEDEESSTTAIRIDRVTGIQVEVRKIRMTVNLTTYASAFAPDTWASLDLTADAGMSVSPSASFTMEAGDTKTVTVTVGNPRVVRDGQVYLFAYWGGPYPQTSPSYGLMYTVDPMPYADGASTTQTIEFTLPLTVGPGYDGETKSIQSHADFNYAVVVTVSACPECGASGVVRGTQEVPSGSPCEVEAQDTPTAKFRRWLEDRGTYKSVVSHDKVYKVSYVYDPMSLIAEFVCLDGNLLANGSSGLVVNDSKTALVVAA